MPSCGHRHRKVKHADRGDVWYRVGIPRKDVSAHSLEMSNGNGLGCASLSFNLVAFQDRPYGMLGEDEMIFVFQIRTYSPILEKILFASSTITCSQSGLVFFGDAFGLREQSSRMPSLALRTVGRLIPKVRAV